MTSNPPISRARRCGSLLASRISPMSSVQPETTALWPPARVLSFLLAPPCSSLLKHLIKVQGGGA